MEGARWLYGTYNCDRLVWFENYQDVKMAIDREKRLKGRRREKKIALIEKTNPAWIDLSKDWYDAEPADLKRATDRVDAWMQARGKTAADPSTPRCVRRSG